MNANLIYQRDLFQGSRGAELHLSIEHRPSELSAWRFIPWDQVPKDIQDEILAGPRFNHGNWDHNEWLKAFETLILADLQEKARAAMELVAA